MLHLYIYIDWTQTHTGFIRFIVFFSLAVALARSHARCKSLDFVRSFLYISIIHFHFIQRSYILLLSLLLVLLLLACSGGGGDGVAGGGCAALCGGKYKIRAKEGKNVYTIYYTYRRRRRKIKRNS